MVTKQTHLYWNPQDKRTLEDSSGNQVRNVSASDLLPMSLMGCSVHDVVEILIKQRQDLREIKITSEHTQDESPPWKFRKIHLKYQIFGKEIDIEKAKKAIKLSEEKYCAVYATLKDVIEITDEVEVIEVE
ncbi:MAG: OsmC family protein [Anaerolineales bacterium]|nr:OsmC family protein [Anaerolineales bacterium]MBX3035971.1 OsmC family protein [Anaerolineales bacterium]